MNTITLAEILPNKSLKHLKNRNGGVDLSLSKEERDFLKQEHTKDFLLIRGVINELDPFGLVKMGAPENEHDSLTGRVLLLMVNNRMNEVRQLILDSYEWYGSGVGNIAEAYKEKFYKKIETTVQKLNELYKEYKQDNLVDS